MAGLLEEAAQLLSSINQQGDESFGMLRAVLGDFVLDPFRKEEASTGSLLASMFKDFNLFIFSAACLWMGYNIIAGLAQTMHEGVVLGKRMSTVWVPVRVSFGIASLMPVFGGWAFAQALMVLACLLGIAGANRISNTAIQSTASFQTTVNPMGNIKQAAQLHNIEQYMVQAVACQRASQDMAAAMQAAGQATPTDFPVTMSGISGYSGGGRTMIEDYEAKGEGAPEFFPYGLTFMHKHVPELKTYAGLTHDPLMQPVVGNFAQGMITMVPLQLGLLPKVPKGADLHAALADHYAGIKGDVAVAPYAETERVPEIEPERYNDTNRMMLHVFANDARAQAVLIAVYDNLGKGASGAAVQNLDLMLGGA